jgi:hypothetical protein
MNQAANGDKKKTPYPFELNPFIAIATLILMLLVQTRKDRIGSLHFKLNGKYLLFGQDFKLLHFMVYIKTKRYNSLATTQI